MFELHPVLAKDTFLIKELKLCKLLLMNNSLYPWVILVPKRADMVEIIDLNKEDRALLYSEIDEVSEIMKREFNADKLNVAALGNMVPQLHIHVIARFKDDACFPSPVWISDEKEGYSDEEKKKVINQISSYIQ